MRLFGHEPRGTAWERLAPAAKATLVLGLQASALLGDARTASLALVASAALLASARHPRRLLLGLVLAPWLALNAGIVGAFVAGEPVLAAGPVSISREGLAAGALAGLKLLAVLVAAQLFLATTPPRGLLDLAGRWPTLAVGLSTSLAAVPAAEEDARRLARAARSRGLAPGPRTWARLAAPLAVATARRGLVLGDALAAAGWEGRRAVYGRMRWGVSEALAVATGIVALALPLAGKI